VKRREAQPPPSMGARAPIDGGGCASRRFTANKPAQFAQI